MTRIIYFSHLLLLTEDEILSFNKEKTLITNGISSLSIYNDNGYSTEYTKEFVCKYQLIANDFNSIEKLKNEFVVNLNPQNLLPPPEGASFCGFVFTSSFQNIPVLNQIVLHNKSFTN